MVVTRFAPSPTGLLHVGNIRVALINCLQAKACGGKFILRIDDTDVSRSKRQYVEAIKEDMQWLGLCWDELVMQSGRLARYELAKQKLIADKRLYPCYETVEELVLKKKSLLSRNLPPIYDRASLKLTDKERAEKEQAAIKPHWRFLLQDQKIRLNDQVRGTMEFDTEKLSDPILIRADGTMTYAIASVVDDIELGITDIIRGEDHISNSAVHVQMFEALGATPPNFAHISLLKSKEGEMSKRLGGFDVQELRNKGVEPMSINSFLAKLGTSDPIHCHFSLDSLIEEFSLKKFGKAAANYDFLEIERLNAKLLHSLGYEEVKTRLASMGLDKVDKHFWDNVKGNLQYLHDIKVWWEICHMEVKPEITDLDFTKAVSKLLPEHEFDASTWDEWIKAIKQQTGRSGMALFMPIRLALTGLEYGPEFKGLLPLLGREKVIARLNGLSA